MRNLSFTYPERSAPAIEELSLKITSGSFVGITGPVGAGKTTLIRLLAREYEIPQGMLFIGGKEVHDYALSAIRKMIITVEQSPFLFSKTIAENILFGQEDADFRAMTWAAENADLHESVISFPLQYDTIVGERGMTLSGGQKQRISIARALLVNRPLLLLDDIFSAIDSSTEKKILQSLKTHLKGKTIVLITHRISVLEQMDRVLYMMNGRIVEDGSPEELMAEKGHFAALAELQRLQGER